VPFVVVLAALFVDPSMAAPPSAATEPASEVTGEGALLNATVNSNGAETTYQFEYGTSPSYGSQAPITPESIGAGNEPVSASETLEGLEPETIYHFRIVASSAEGTTYGEDETFATWSEWTLESPPNPEVESESQLNDVSCVSATSCLAVGYDEYQAQGLAEIWNGEKWTRREGAMDSKSTAVSCNLTGSITYCMAVGEMVDGSPYAQRWKTSGALWVAYGNTAVPLVPEGGSEVALKGVSCSTEWSCTVVGSYRKEGKARTLAERYSGEANTWSVQATATAAGFALSDVACPTASECIAVGNQPGSPFSKALAERWNGSEWSTLSVPIPVGSTISSVKKISCASASACLATGTSSGGGSAAFTMAWDGSSWTLAGAAPSAYTDISCGSETACIAAGAKGGDIHVESWSGSEWSAQPSPSPEGKSASLAGVSCPSALACMAVGKASANGETETLALRYGSEWTLESPPNPEVESESQLNDVSCVSATSCLAVGYDEYQAQGLAEIWNGEKWTRREGAMDSKSTAVSCNLTGSITYCMAVGEMVDGSPYAQRWKTSGALWVAYGNTAVPLVPEGGSEVALKGVSCSTEWSCTVVGSYRKEGKARTLAERYSGEANTWSVQATATAAGFALSDVACPTASECIAVGNQPGSPFSKALAERWNGSEWSTLSVPIPVGSTISSVKKISCASASACLATGTSSGGGSAAFTMAWDGSSWTLAGAAPSAYTDISCGSETACIAAGAKGGDIHVESWSGSEWSAQPSPSPEGKSASLAGVSCPSALACMAVGKASANGETETLALRYGSLPLPVALTDPVGDVSQESVTLNGTVNPGGLKTTYQFEYTDAADFEANDYANAIDVPASPKSIGLGTVDIGVSEPVEGLQAETTYRYRIVAENSQGRAEGEDGTFTTLEPPPTCQGIEATTGTGQPRELSLACSGSGGLSYAMVSGPEHGSISAFDPDAGALIYTSDEEFTGADSFTFNASNAGGDSNAATATINVCNQPEIEAGGEVKEPETPGVGLSVSAWSGEPHCHLGEEEEEQMKALRVYIDDELVYSEELDCEDAEDPCVGSIERGVQLPYMKVIGTHTYRVEAEDPFGIQAEPMEWTESTPEGGTISQIPPEAEDSKGSKGCETPKNRYQRYVFRAETVYGTACADILVRYPGHNTKTYKTGAGDDVVRVGGEINTIRGGTGNDRIYAGRGNDKVFGEAGDDQIVGGSGDDTLQGNSGNDIVSGSAGADEIFGNQGDDLVRGGTTTDKLDGGSGSNTVSFAEAVTPGFEFGSEFVAGFPTASSRRGIYVNLNEAPLKDGDGNEYLRAFNGNTARFGGGADRLYLGGGTFQNVIGSPFADVVIGSGEANLIDGSGGPDIIEGSSGNDQLFGGADSDLVDGDGDQGAGNLHGGDGDDICVNGTESSQSCERESTAEGLKPTSSASIVIGRLNPNDPSSDTGIYLRGSTGGDNVTATWDGGHEKEVNDVVHFVAKGKSGTGRFDTAANGVSGCTVAANEATCPLSAVHTLTMDGGDGNDVLKAHSFPASIAVTLLGGADRDVLHGGGESEDVLVDGPGEGKDDLYGFGDDDTFFANEGRDRLYGAGGSDLFVSSSACEDTVVGGGDRDNASWAQLRGEAKGESGEFHDPVNGVDVSLPAKAGDWGEISRLGAGCGEDGQLKEIEFLEGSGGKDRLEGDDAHNIVLGRSGKDILIGLGGDDNLLANNRDPAGETEEKEHDPDETLNCGGGNDKLRYDKPYDNPAKLDGSCEKAKAAPPAQSSAVSGIGSEATSEAATPSLDQATIGGAGDPEATPPVAFFRLDEGGGTTAANWSDDEASGTYEGSVALDEPGAMEESRAVHLDGEGEYLDLTNDWDPEEFTPYSCEVNVNGYSIEMWVKFDSAATGREALFSRSEGGNGLFVYRSADGRINFSIDRPAGELPTVRTDEAVSEDEWHHVVATVEHTFYCLGQSGTTVRRMALYVDGFAYPLYSGNSPFPQAMPSAHNLVGARDTLGGLTDWLNAEVDNVAIYGHPLSESEVQTHLAVSDAVTTPVILVPPVDPENGDADGDGIRDSVDNCIMTSNAGQEDSDGDGVGDACQMEPDSDEDDVPDLTDNCPDVANKEQTDSDENGVGDACEPE
jgi:Ca2+-binding RTX toxin-like protein